MAGAGTRMYVGNLAWAATSEQLRAVMEEAGDVDECRIVEGRDGRSRGYAIVTFANAEGAEASKELTDREIEGRRIFVREDREGPEGAPRRERPARRERAPREPREDAPRRRQPREEQGEPSGLSLHVGNLAWSVEWQALKEHFAEFAPSYANVARDRNSQRSRGWGTVRFDSKEDAAAAMEALNESELEGRNITVRLDQRA